MFKTHRISSVDDVFFKESWACYLSSFPESERRLDDEHARALGDERFHMLRFEDEGGFAGILCYWVGTQSIYGEHFAIAESRRGQGLGSSLLLHVLKTFELPFVLEIEPLVDDLTHARYRFYKSLGFHLLPDEHVQLAYHAGAAALPLLLLSYPTPLSSEEVKAFQAFLHEDIARYNQR